MFIIRWLYYAYMNLIYYRHEQQITRDRLSAIVCVRDINDVKFTLTNACLATVGLKIVENDSDIIPWYIPLSNAQKSWIKQASIHGYKVGLV